MAAPAAGLAAAPPAGLAAVLAPAAAAPAGASSGAMPRLEPRRRAMAKVRTFDRWMQATNNSTGGHDCSTI